MPQAKHDVFEPALQTAHTWLADVARQVGTDDRRFAYRALRAWLHTLRDRLPVEAAVKFAAQLPELIRGVFYDGWEPARAPMKFGPDEYVVRFAREALVRVEDVPVTAAAVTAALTAHLSAGQLPEVLALLPQDLRAMLSGPGAAPTMAGRAARDEGSGQAGAPPAEAGADRLAVLAMRLQRIEVQLEAVTEAVRVLARGLEASPEAETDEQRGTKAARLAHEILLAARR